MEERTIDEEFNLSKVKDEPIDDDTDDDDNASRNSDYHEVEVDVKLEVEDKTYDPSECGGVKDGTGEFNDSDIKMENEVEHETLSDQCPSVLKISKDGSIVHTEENELGFSAIDFIPSNDISNIGSSKIVKQFLKKFICNYCSYATSSRVAISCHMNKHSRVTEPLECDICVRKFNNHRDFEYHMNKIHPDIRMNKCDICSYSTSFKRNLKRHIDLIHLGKVLPKKNEIYKCKLCPFESDLQTRLFTHLKKKHSLNNNYPCKKCNKNFDCFSSLKQHKLKEHDNLSLYRCEICSYFSVTKRSLQIHMSKVHKKSIINEINAGMTNLI